MLYENEQKYPYSANLFTFAHHIIAWKRSEPDSRYLKKVASVAVGELLQYNAADCSYWKRGVKNVRFLRDLEKLAEALEVEDTLVFDVASGVLNAEEAIFEYHQRKAANEVKANITPATQRAFDVSYKRICKFVDDIHGKANFEEAPLYLPEIVRFFSFVSIKEEQSIEDKRTNVSALTYLAKSGSRYVIHYQEGALSSQARWAVCYDLATIVLKEERSRYPELGKYSDKKFAYECLVFCAQLLCPQKLMLSELSLRINPCKDVVSELSKTFWVSPTLINFQLKNTLGSLYKTEESAAYLPSNNQKEKSTAADV